MRNIFYLSSLLLLMSCSSSNYIKKKDGLEIKIQQTSEKIRLMVYSENIIRVSVSQPNKSFSGDESLIVEEKPVHGVDWSVKETENSISISTIALVATVNKNTGEISFSNLDGIPLLKEKVGGGRKYGKDIDLDLPETTFQQVFESPNDEAFYGLGQHQNGEVNYKGLDVELMQNNIVAVVPFVFSNKNYGLLWDNYSITRFGDPRNYESIQTLQLFDADGNPGGLTAKYFDKGNHLFLSRVEETIDYSSLDQQSNYPEDFEMSEKSRIVWEGFLQSEMTGQHKFKLWAAGYFKLWVDGELIIDKWRQCWNPWYNKFYLDLQPDKKSHIKIEWKPDASVSYIGLSYLDPAYHELQDKLSLASEDGKQIDYYFIKGNDADEVISGYRSLTGKSPIMPKWAMGLWQSRERYKNQEQLLEVVREYRKRKLPFDNIVLDWNYWPQDKWGDHEFDARFWPEPEEMIREIHEDHNANIMISVWPKFYTGTQNFNHFKDNDWLFLKNVELENYDWVGPGYLSTFYDAYNPGARKAFWNGLNDKLFSKGIDAWWLDATEPDIHSNVSIEEKKSTLTPNYLGTGTEYFNSYSLLQAKGVYEGQRQTNPDKRVFILTRSMFAGQQRYSAATWSGDIVSRWSDLRDQWAAGINVGLSGIPYWTTDIGGFAVEKRYEHPNANDLKEWRELNTRWYQFGAFCPIFRIHGQFPFREIWNIAPEGTEEYNSMFYYDQLRYRMMPYIYSLAGNTYHQNYTIMRGLIMDFSADRKVEKIADQYMFGDAFMVCPVGQYKQRKRNVYLPSTAGWYDFYTNQYFEGGQTIVQDAPVGKIPLMIKEGSIVPFGPEIQYTTQVNDGSLKILVYTGANAEFELYEDENVNYNYEKGAFSFIPMKYSEENKTFTVGQREGDFNQMIKQRTIEIYFVDENSRSGFDLNAKADARVFYKGELLEIEKRE